MDHPYPQTNILLSAPTKPCLTAEDIFRTMREVSDAVAARDAELVYIGTVDGEAYFLPRSEARRLELTLTYPKLPADRR